MEKYRVIFKKVLFGIFRIFLVSKEVKNFTRESKDQELSLSKFPWYLVDVIIIKIWHLKGHISQKKLWFENYFYGKINAIMLLYLCKIFIFLLDHLQFFLHFFFTFMENFFKKHPISQKWGKYSGKWFKEH